MSSFHLIIVTPDGPRYDGEAERLTVRTTEGEVTILPRHIDYAASLGMGPAYVVCSGDTRKAACIGGMLAVTQGEVRLIASSFEWIDEIDLERARRSLLQANEKLSDPNLSESDRAVYSARRRRALVRISAANQ